MTVKGPSASAPSSAASAKTDTKSWMSSAAAISQAALRIAGTLGKVMSSDQAGVEPGQVTKDLEVINQEADNIYRSLGKTFDPRPMMKAVNDYSKDPQVQAGFASLASGIDRATNGLIDVAVTALNQALITFQRILNGPVERAQSNYEAGKKAADPTNINPPGNRTGYGPGVDYESAAQEPSKTNASPPEVLKMLSERSPKLDDISDDSVKAALESSPQLLAGLMNFFKDYDADFQAIALRFAARGIELGAVTFQTNAERMASLRATAKQDPAVAQALSRFETAVAGQKKA